MVAMPKIPGLKWEVRVAEEGDIPTILDLCYQLSVYEKIEFKGTEELYRRYGFSKDKIFDCLLAENTNRPENEIRRVLTGEMWFTAEEAVAFGLADDILQESSLQLRDQSTKEPIGPGEIEGQQPNGTPPVAELHLRLED